MKIFIVHGWTYTLDAWRELAAILQDQGHEPILLRVPGLTIPSDYPWTIEDYVSWLREQIGEEKNPVLIGHSNGGRIAMAYCATYPKHLRHLILIDSAGIERKEKRTTLKRRVGRLLAPMIRPFVRGRAARALYRLIGAGDYGRAEPHMRQTMKHMLAADSGLAIESVKTPVTLIWGADDKATPVSDADVLKQRLPKVAATHIIDGAGHSPHKTHAAQTAELIIKTIKKL